MSSFLLVAGGLVLLVIGGELLVRGAVAIATRLGMSSLLIGLTLVGFGTSAPELVTSVQASLSGSPGVALGNIVGSNIANILLILGISAMIAPVAVGSKALGRDGVVVLFSAIVLTLVGYLWQLDRAVGGLLFAGLLFYLYWAYRQEMAPPPVAHTAAFEKSEAYEELHNPHLVDAPAPTEEERNPGLALSVFFAVGGLAIIVLGGRLLVTGAIDIAREAGVSETLIGLTIVSIGTSLPELVTSVIAALRKHGDVALGNVLGSNIYNTLGIAGATGVIAPTTFPPELVRFDLIVMLGASVVLLIFARTGYRIGRREGTALFAGYCVYLYSLWP